jgi:outer membrane protein TolC
MKAVAVRGRVLFGLIAAWFAGLHAGCCGMRPVAATPLLALGQPGVPAAADAVAPAQVDGSISLASHVVEEQPELHVDALVDQVLARNPTIAQMTAAWQAASARYPQVISLDDPMLTGIIGPASIGSDDVEFAYRLEASQKIPWHGKLALRGQNALAEASAAGRDIDDIRLQLIESTRTAYYDYYLVERALAVNEESLRLLDEFRENALTRFRTGQTPQQDILQADVEIGRQRERLLTLERMKKVAIARINTLMHLPTCAPLPPAPREIEHVEVALDLCDLQTRALAQRPDLKALADRIAAEEASLGLAYKEFCPDFEVMAAYDAFWQPKERDLRPMLGVRLNLPVRKDRRHAAVAEAQARIAQRQAELARQTDQVNLQVAEAYEQLRESERALQLYNETILPAARENVKAAVTAYSTGKAPFLTLIEAERNLINIRDRFYETSADVLRRRATLERVIGGPLLGAVSLVSQ